MQSIWFSLEREALCCPPEELLDRKEGGIESDDAPLPLLKCFEQPHDMTLSVSPKRQVAMHSHILIRRHVVEHGSFASLRAALRRLQDVLQRERESSEALPKDRLYLSDIVAAFDYRLSELDLLDADAKMLAARRERDAAFDAVEQAWWRLCRSY